MRARVADVSPSAVVAGVIARTAVERPSPSVVVFPAMPKSGKLETVVQKLTELGVDEIRPWFAARSVVRWDADKAATRLRRLRAIAREAAMQCRRSWLPTIGEPGPLEKLPETTIVLDESGPTGLTASLPSVAPLVVGVVVGPEGAGLVARGVCAVSLGPAILRTETASIIGPALVLARYERLG